MHRIHIPFIFPLPRIYFRWERAISRRTNYFLQLPSEVVSRAISRRTNYFLQLPSEVVSRAISKTGSIIGAKILTGSEEVEEEIVVISKKGQVIRVATGEISTLSRATQGVRIMKMREGDSIASMVAL